MFPGYFGGGYFGGYFGGGDSGVVAPSAPPAVISGPGGSPYADRDESNEDFLREVERLRRQERGEWFRVEVSATSLRVEVHATVLTVNVIERGNLLYFSASFAEEPDEVFFAYTRPGEERPIVDPGYGQPGSKISRTDDGVFVFVIDTTGFSGGTLEWHFWSPEGDPGQASEFGEIAIRPRKAQLL